MKPEDKKLILGYMGWETHDLALKEGRMPTEKEAVHIMEERGDLSDFYKYADNVFINGGVWKGEGNYEANLFYHIIQKSFFPLMAEWLKERGI
jgi:hypothetical protein